MPVWLDIKWIFVLQNDVTEVGNIVSRIVYTTEVGNIVDSIVYVSSPNRFSWLLSRKAGRELVN